ncbi:MAG: hypothetical protein AUJ49_05770 [Desulfovibrionaceae bacterium CG1_02_65_16]|nr:MAG: hypothetical protein AUJ49_05770 [Desulfovibrionaceae bacterium CG1_02_65_16]
MSGADRDAPAVTLLDVRVVRQGRAVLRVRELVVKRGEFLGVIGPNGSGKSTLLAVVAGRLRPATGKILGAGTAGGRVALAAQMTALDPRLPISILESVMVGAYAELGALRRPGPKVRARARQLLDMVGIAHLADRPIGLCSGGEAQRAAIARALLQRPDVLLLDEPTSALDWRAQREILACIKDIHSRLGLTTVMVTHELNALPELCDRVLVLRAGEPVWLGSAREALTPQRLAETFGIPFTVLDHRDRPVVLF